MKFCQMYGYGKNRLMVDISVDNFTIVVLKVDARSKANAVFHFSCYN